MIIKDSDQRNRVVCEELVSYNILVVKRTVLDTRYAISDTFGDRFNDMFYETNHNKLASIIKCLSEYYHIRDKTAITDYTLILDQMIEMQRIDGDESK